MNKFAYSARLENEKGLCVASTINGHTKENDDYHLNRFFKATPAYEAPMDFLLYLGGKMTAHQYAGKIARKIYRTKGNGIDLWGDALSLGYAHLRFQRGINADLTELTFVRRNGELRHCLVFVGSVFEVDYNNPLCFSFEEYLGVEQDMSKNRTAQIKRFRLDRLKTTTIPLPIKRFR